MSGRMIQEMALRLRDAGQLFAAPAQDVFSDLEVEIAGESGIDRLRRQLRPGLRGFPGDLHLTIHLPADEITPGLEERLTTAVRRYADLRTRDNLLAICADRRSGLRGFAIAFAIAAIAILASTALLKTAFAHFSDIEKLFISGPVTLFVWVILWTPLDTLVNYWIPYRRDNQLLAHLAGAKFILRPWE